MKTYFIEPGDWESATGECLPGGSEGIAVVTVDEMEKEMLRLRQALQDIIRHNEIMGGQLSHMSALGRMAKRALEKDEP